MAVASRGDALSAFRELINNDPIKAEKVLLLPSYLPPGLEPVEDPFAMNSATLIGGYGKEASYALLAPDPSMLPIIAGPPADVLSGRPSITSEAQRPIEAYVKASLDLTMEGGTTSGVVYPLAVCELATKFRFRNVGGASAASEARIASSTAS